MTKKKDPSELKKRGRKPATDTIPVDEAVDSAKIGQLLQQKFQPYLDRNETFEQFQNDIANMGGTLGRHYLYDTGPKSQNYVLITQGTKKLKVKNSLLWSWPKTEPVDPVAIAGELIARDEVTFELTPPPSEETVTSEVAILDDRAVAGLASLGGLSTNDLKLQLQTETEQRGVIKQFAQYHLQNDTDYGRIHVVPKDRCPAQYDCKNDYHYSKAVLFKPGMEKLFSLFKITTKLEKDQDAYEMLPDERRLVAYRCIMMRGDQMIGEGRGAAVVGDNRRDVNATIKIAQKRARMDACLSLGFSEYFAQDLDDPDYASAAQMANQKAAAAAERIDKDEFGLYPRDASLPMNDDERTTLFKYLQLRGIDTAQMRDVLKENGIPDALNVTSGKAREMIAALKNNLYAMPKLPEAAEPGLPVIDVNEDLNDPTPPAAPTAAVATEPELIVDDELKAEIKTRASNLGLNGTGKVWLMRMINGKPFGKFERFTDPEWRKAYDVVMGIMDGHIQVEDKMVAGFISGTPTPPPVDFTESANAAERDAAMLQDAMDSFPNDNDNDDLTPPAAVPADRK